MANHIFAGYSTATPGKSRSWALYDFDLINRDLMNIFMTRLGERLMRPTYGCSIWDYVGEQLTPDVVEAIENEAERIVSLDTRLSFQSIEISTTNNGIIILIRMLYIPYNTVASFQAAFEVRQ